jgi:hypothetical protein
VGKPTLAATLQQLVQHHGQEAVIQELIDLIRSGAPPQRRRARGRSYTDEDPIVLAMDAGARRGVPPYGIAMMSIDPAVRGQARRKAAQRLLAAQKAKRKRDTPPSFGIGETLQATRLMLSQTGRAFRAELLQIQLAWAQLEAATASLRGVKKNSSEQF